MFQFIVKSLLLSTISFSFCFFHTHPDFLGFLWLFPFYDIVIKSLWKPFSPRRTKYSTKHKDLNFTHKKQKLFLAFSSLFQHFTIHVHVNTFSLFSSRVELFKALNFKQPQQKNKLFNFFLCDEEREVWDVGATQ